MHSWRIVCGAAAESGEFLEATGAGRAGEAATEMAEHSVQPHSSRRKHRIRMY